MKEPFKIIKLNKDQRKALKVFVNDLSASATAFKAASYSMKNNEDSLWEKIRLIFDDANEYEASFDHKTFELILYNKKIKE